MARIEKRLTTAMAATLVKSTVPKPKRLRDEPAATVIDSLPSSNESGIDIWSSPPGALPGDCLSLLVTGFITCLQWPSPSRERCR